MYVLSPSRLNDFLHYIFRYTYEEDCEKATDSVPRNAGCTV